MGIERARDEKENGKRGTKGRKGKRKNRGNGIWGKGYAFLALGGIRRPCKSH